jgi:DNA-binding beta-propeller fold protein YncE
VKRSGDVKSLFVAVAALAIAAGGCAADGTNGGTAPGDQSRPFARNRSTAAQLFVADQKLDAVEILGGGYEKSGSISTGIDGPVGDWIDASGDLYVANYRGKDVTEYAPGATSPTCTYSKGLRDPINVTTDENANVFVVDYNLGRPGFVDVYAQCSNRIASQYSVGGAPEGAAVDSSGNLFVDYNAGGTGALEEFLSGSTLPTQLGATFTFAGGMILDAKGNLIVCDQGPGYVDQVAPPYNFVTLEYNGFKDPLNVTLSQDQKLLFVADPQADAVRILRYPSGVVVKALHASRGFKVPVGIAAYPNGAQ